jgi:MFS family permease
MEETDLNNTQSFITRGSTFVKDKPAEVLMKKVRICNLILFLLGTPFLNGISIGFSYGYTNQATPLIEAQYHWETKEQRAFYNSLIGASFILGIVLGSAPAGKLVQYGRRKLIIVSIVIMMIGTSITLVERVWCLLLGRVICGIARGFFNIAVTRMQEEFIPPHLYSTLGPSYPVSCTLGTFLATCSGLLLPPDSSSQKTLQAVTIWRYIFGFPLIPLALAMVL